MLYGIQPDQIKVVWPEVEPWISAACKRNRGKYDAQDILAGLLSGTDQLWIWRSPTAYAVGITRLSNYPRCKVCAVRIVTGTNSAEWRLQTLATIEQWARTNGCASMELVARKGWARHLKDYDMTHVMLEKHLSKELEYV